MVQAAVAKRRHQAAATLHAVLPAMAAYHAALDAVQARERAWTAEAKAMFAPSPASAVGRDWPALLDVSTRPATLFPVVEQAAREGVAREAVRGHAMSTSEVMKAVWGEARTGGSATQAERQRLAVTLSILAQGAMQDCVTQGEKVLRFGRLVIPLRWHLPPPPPAEIG